MTTTNLLLCILLFTVGFANHTYKAASVAVQKKAIDSKREWLIKYAYVLLSRYGVVLALFCLYATNPALLDQALGWAGFKESYSLPVTKPISYIMGYFSDSILDFIAKKIPFLSHELPPNADDAALPAE